MLHKESFKYLNNDDSDVSGDFINKSNNLTYIAADHLIGGIEIITGVDSRIAVEAFYKRYSNYPFSVSDSISLASRGGEFGTIGDPAEEQRYILNRIANTSGTILPTIGITVDL